MNIILFIASITILPAAIYFLARALINFSVRDLNIKYSKEDKEV